VLSLKNGSLDVNIPDQSGWNPLLFCVRYGNLPAMTKLLYTPGIDINYRMADGWNSVLLAAAYGHLEVLKLLVNHGGASLDIDVRYNGMDILFIEILSLTFATQAFHLETLHTLMEKLRQLHT